MNIYNYFQKIEKECKSVPSKNEGLYRWLIFQSKQAALSKNDAFDVIVWASEALQDETLDPIIFKNEARSKVLAKKQHWFTREISDFGLYLFVYITCFNVLYEAFFEKVSFQLEITIGFVIQVIGVYLSLKWLIYFLASDPVRSSLKFWLLLACSFLIYMIANQMPTLYPIHLLTMPVFIWVILSIVCCAISLWYAKKEKVI